jgi:hypothetical protein
MLGVSPGRRPIKQGNVTKNEQTLHRFSTHGPSTDATAVALVQTPCMVSAHRLQGGSHKPARCSNLCQFAHSKPQAAQTSAGRCVRPGRLIFRPFPPFSGLFRPSSNPLSGCAGQRRTQRRRLRSDRAPAFPPPALGESTARNGQARRLQPSTAPAPDFFPQPIHTK